MKFFSHDSPFGEFMSVLVDIVLLSMLWILTSLPLITIGASTTAMLYTANKSIRQGQGYLFRMYFKAFGREFMQSTVLWCFLLVYYVYTFTDILVTFLVNASPEDLNLGMVIFKLVVFGIVTLWTQYWFAYLSKFKDNIRTILGNTLRISISHILASVVLLLLFAIIIGLLYLSVMHFPAGILFLPGGYALFAMYIFEDIFGNYIPQPGIEETAEEASEDADTEPLPEETTL